MPLRYLIVIAKKSSQLAVFAVLLAAGLWGLDSVVLTPRLYNLNTGFVVFMLHLIPFALMQLFLFKEYKKLKSFSKEDWFYLLLIALFGGVVGTLAIVKALFLVNFQALSVVVILQKLQPIFAIILAAIILKEKLSKEFILWALLAIVAAYFVSFGLNLPNFQSGRNATLAIIYALIAAASFGSATVFGKKILNSYNFETTVFYRFGLTTLLMFIYLAFFGKLKQFSDITPTNWLIFLIIAFTTGSSAMFLYYWGLKHLRANITTILELFFPISAIIFDYLINHNSLSLVQWIAIVLMIVAIIRINRLKDSY